LLCNQWSTLAKIVEGDTIYTEALFGDTRLLKIAPLASGYASILVVPWSEMSELDMDPDRTDWERIGYCTLCTAAVIGCQMGAGPGMTCEPRDFVECHYCSCKTCPCPDMYSTIRPQKPTPTKSPKPTLPPVFPEKCQSELNRCIGQVFTCMEECQYVMPGHCRLTPSHKGVAKVPSGMS